MEPHPLAWYHACVPRPALRTHICSLFSFVPDPRRRPAGRLLLREVAFQSTEFCSPQFAGGHVSIVFEPGRTCDADGCWREDSGGRRGTATAVVWFAA